MDSNLLKILKEEGCLAYRLHAGKAEPTTELFSISRKTMGIAYLLEAADADLIADDLDMAGLGLILRELAQQISQITEYLDAAPGKKK